MASQPRRYDRWVTDREIRLRYRAPLLKMAQVAVFRQITMGRARNLYRFGELPRGERANGELFIAERKFVVRALQFRQSLDEPTQKVFDAWQRGEIEIVEPRSDSEQGVLPSLPEVGNTVSTKRAKEC
jgi:hypothetical protein